MVHVEAIREAFSAVGCLVGSGYAFVACKLFSYRAMLEHERDHPVEFFPWRPPKNSTEGRLLKRENCAASVGVLLLLIASIEGEAALRDLGAMDYVAILAGSAGLLGPLCAIRGFQHWETRQNGRARARRRHAVGIDRKQP